MASTVPGSHIALTLALYLTVYAALLLAYVSVVKHMAEKPVPMPDEGGHVGVQGARGSADEPTAGLASLASLNAAAQSSTQPGAGT